MLAFGNRAHLDLVPGLAQHALPLKLVGDALHIRNRVLQRLARIELEHDPERAASSATSSSSAAASPASRWPASWSTSCAARGATTRACAMAKLKVTLLHDIDRLLPELLAAAGAAAALRSLQQRGVAVELKGRAASVHAAA